MHPRKRRRVNKNIEIINLAVIPNDLPSKLWRDYYLDESTADIHFVCGDKMERIPTHQMILSQASKVLHNMFYGNETEKDNADIVLPKTSPEKFKSFLQFIYLDLVDFGTENVTVFVDLEGKYRTPIHRLLYELNILPEQNSPMHILNVLYDKCIQAVLGNLTDPEDYLNAAEVCSKFKINAKKAFPSKFTSVSNKLIPAHAISRFLKVFGSLVLELDWDQVDDNLNMIAAYCGKTLNKLVISGHDIDFNTPLPFQALKSIELNIDDDGTISNFGQHPQLFSLTLIGRMNIDIGRHFPKLGEMIFHEFPLTENHFTQFLYLNPQLHRLVINCTTIPSIIVEQIAHFGHNIDFLHFYSNLRGNDLIPISRLRNLNWISVPNDCESISKLFDSFSENDVHIERLNLRECVSNTETVLQSMSKLKYLTTIILTLDYIPDDFLINIVNELTELEEIHTYGNSNISLYGIVKILKNGKKLNKLKFRVKFIDMKYYNLISSLAKNRVKVTIDCDSCTVPEDVLNENRDWLNITEWCN